jgi:hypothetical protein
MTYQVCDDDGTPLDAHYDIDGDTIVFHARGGTKGSANALNTDYSLALNVLVGRISQSEVAITDAWVDSSRTQNLSIEERRILSANDLSLGVDAICAALSSRMKDVGRKPNAKPSGGNSTKRIRIQLSEAVSVSKLNQILGGLKTDKDTRSRERLPTSELGKVGEDHIWRAVQKLLGGYSDHGFSLSTDYDLITDDGERLDPKAVFGVAASEALGFKVLPRHFTGGVGTLCFRTLSGAGYSIVEKGSVPKASEPIPPTASDLEWAEGKAKVVTHLKKERGRGLSKAKKADFIIEHGRLFCERCEMDPVSVYGEDYGEACIEVHHHEVGVEDMPEGHRTKLSDLKCLCANCHRIVHRELSAAVSSVK